MQITHYTSLIVPPVKEVIGLRATKMMLFMTDMMSSQQCKFRSHKFPYALNTGSGATHNGLIGSFLVNERTKWST